MTLDCNKVNLIIFTFDRKVKYDIADYINELIKKDEKLKEYDIDIKIGKYPNEIIEEKLEGFNNDKYEVVYMG